MADFVHVNVAGKWRGYLDGSLGAGALGILLLKTTEADSTLRTRNTVADLLAATGTAEANWTSGTAYARKTGITPTFSQSASAFFADIPDPVWATAGSSASYQDVLKLVAFWRFTANTADSSSIVIASADFPDRANGADITGTINATGLLTAQT